MRAQYPGSSRLSDEELTIFVSALAERFPPGTFIPLWANRFVKRWRDGRIHADPNLRLPSRDPSEATVGPNIDITSSPTSVFSESFIAVDRSNPQRIIAGANQISGDAQMLFWSHDGGTTWTTELMALGGKSFHSDPGLAWDSRGDGYATAIGCDISDCEIQIVKTLDGGQTWSGPDVVHASPSNDKPLVAANDQPGTMCQDVVCVAWNDIIGVSMELHVACSPGGNGPWAPNDLIIEQDQLIGAVPAFGPDGELVVAWANIRKQTIDFARSDDCGQSFSMPLSIGTTLTSFDMGITPMCSRRALIYPAIDVDRSSNPTTRGNMYAVWLDAEPGGNCPFSGCPASCVGDVVFSRSTDGGASWSPQTIVHSNLPGVDQFNPWLAVNDSDGSVHVMWYDTRADPSRDRTEVYYRTSIDGGMSWLSEERVSAGQTDETASGADQANQYGDYNGLAAFQCSSYPIWTDRSAGRGEQIFTARVSDGAGAPPPDIVNTLRGVKNPVGDPDFTWDDVNSNEEDYSVYRGVEKDPVTFPPVRIGQSGGPDATFYTDMGTPTATGIWYYKIRASGPCGIELSTW